MAGQENYEEWTRESLIERIKQLEAQIPQDNVAGQLQPAQGPKPQQPPSSEPPAPAINARERRRVGKEEKQSKRGIDSSKWTTRYIALKLAYLGKNYGGFEHQSHDGASPTIELELWKALTVSRLVTPEDTSIVDWECCEYSKCGRTDRGVSSFGQVIALRVRSRRPPTPTPTPATKKPRLDAGVVEEDTADVDADARHADVMDIGETPMSASASTSASTSTPASLLTPPREFDPIKDEFEYCRMLNRLLPPDIRILAWCPAPRPGFSARFSCRERQYRYFFTQPAFSPLPVALAKAAGRDADATREGWLDIEAMREAARLFEGEHDFRNLCKLDPSKQISNYKRTIFEARVEEVADARPVLPYLNEAGFTATGTAAGAGETGGVWPKVYSFNVNGSAFLWHQIRHMVAILFLVGQGFEQPSVVSDLLDVERNPRRPPYAMADHVPLVLWDCVFPDLDGDNTRTRRDTVDWVYVGDEDIRAKYGNNGLVDVLWEGWRGRMMDEFLSARLMGLVAAQGKRADEAPIPITAGGGGKLKMGGQARLFAGGDTWKSGGVHVPLMKRSLQASPDELNERYAKKCGYANSEEMKWAKGYK